jgi:hypothetical protein
MTQYTAAQLEEISKLVDEIGLKKAELAQPLEELAALEDKLKRYGAGKYSGDFYDATVSVFDRLIMAKDKVLAKLKRLGLNEPEKWYKENCSATVVTQLRCTAKQKARAERSTIEAPQLAA